jgi:pimeloyl-ACP methyl ester carboxylesterase
MRRAILAAAVGAALSFAGGAGSASAPSLELRACPTNQFSGFDGGAIFPSDLRVDCGTLAVPENRSKPQSRTIRIGVAIVHAPNGNPRPDPIVFMNGGPSIGSIQEFAMFYYFGGWDYLRDRDVIILDTRGEGVSQPYLADPRLGCPEEDVADEETFFAKPYIGSGFGPRFDQAIRDCRARLVSEGVDLSGYTAAEESADLEALRKALGVRQWNVWVASADGVLGLTYMRLYPGGIRSAVLDSPQNSAMNIAPDYIRGKRDNLERAFAGCAAFPKCAQRYPGLRTKFYDLVHQLQANPVDVTTHITNATIVVHVDGVGLMYFALNQTDADSVMNLLNRLWRATHGELKQVYEQDLSGRPFFGADFYQAQGRTLSYVCHDLVAFIPQSEYDRLAADVPELAPDINSPYFDHPVGKAACAIWNNGIAEPAQHKPVVSSIPTMITDGEYDTGVPRTITRQIPGTLRNGTLYEFPAVGHLPLAGYNHTSGCARQIAEQFLDAPTSKPDSSCIASLPQMDYTP